MSQQLRELKKEWYRRLQTEGFVDIEDSKHRLKSKDRRTIAFENRDQIRDFFLDLDAFITNSPDLNPLHRQILELYSSGTYVKYIALTVNKSLARVKQIIGHYKTIVNNQRRTG